MIAFQCPHCLTNFTARDELAGKKIKCRSCGEAVRVNADAAEPEPNEESAPARGARLPPRRKTQGKSSRAAGSTSARSPALDLAIKFGPYAAAVIVLIGMLAAAKSNKTFREASMFVSLGLGALHWIVAYYWGLTIAIRFDSSAVVGYLLPKAGMRYIAAHREHMAGPFRLLLIGLAFIAAGAAFGWIDHKQAGY
jgi:hypothetical protein